MPVLAIDAGTTVVTALVVGEQGDVLARVTTTGDLRLYAALALVGAVLSVVFRSRVGVALVVVGLGLALAFQANAMSFAAALALTAALFHVLNHCLFKSLLFFGAGAVLVASGERDMERLGGLIHGMPRTALAFLIGGI